MINVNLFVVQYLDYLEYALNNSYYRTQIKEALNERKDLSYKNLRQELVLPGE